MTCLVQNGLFFFFLFFIIQGENRGASSFTLLFNVLSPDERKRKHDVSLPTLKKGRPVLKAIVASPVHSADGLIAITVRVLHLHFPTENHNNFPGCKPGLNVKTLLGKM